MDKFVIAHTIICQLTLLDISKLFKLNKTKEHATKGSLQ